MPPSAWLPDDALPGYERLTLHFTPDYDGPVVATLLRKRPAQPVSRAVLYVHGFADYFFQRHVGDRFAETGRAFYALDLRKYGTFVHSGFGLGLERTVAWICGRQHIRETIPFPRMLNRLTP